MSKGVIPLTQQPSPFDAIRQLTEQRIEYWSARDLAQLLDYKKWQKFREAIARAETEASKSGREVSNHFTRTGKLIRAGKGATRQIEDTHLSRYGAYLVAMNADPNKPRVAEAQTYFAAQTRRAELADAEAFATLSEDNKRLSLRSE